MTIQLRRRRLGVGRLVVSVVGVVLRARSTHSGHRLRARAAADAAGRYRQSLQSAARSDPWREQRHVVCTSAAGQVCTYTAAIHIVVETRL